MVYLYHPFSSSVMVTVIAPQAPPSFLMRFVKSPSTLAVTASPFASCRKKDVSLEVLCLMSNMRLPR